MASGSGNLPPWPATALKAYEPIRPLAKGGFGSVYLARKRDVPEGSNANFDTTVAMKLVSRGASASRTRSEAGYAKREVQILSELKHPHIIRLVDVFYDDEKKGGDSNSSSDPVPRCFALSLARGPTLELMLKEGGALGLPMAREITTQLVDTIAYLHGRAVIHRDIKPGKYHELVEPFFAHVLLCVRETFESTDIVITSPLTCVCFILRFYLWSRQRHYKRCQANV